MKVISVVMQKELDRIFKDKKLIFSLFILPAIMLFAIYGLMGLMISNMVTDIAEHESIVYAVNAPADFKSLVMDEDYDLTWSDISTDKVDEVKEQIRFGDADLLILFPDNFSEAVANWKNGDPVPEVRTFYNPAEDYSSSAREDFVNYFLPDYQEALLKTRFDDLNALRAFDVDNPVNEGEEASEITKEGQQTGQFLGMLFPYLIVMMLFTGPMSLGVDAIAGEKERGTLASMLITPAKRQDIVLGKLFSLEILAFLSALVYAVSMIFALPMISGSLSAGAGIGGLISPLSVIQIIVIMVVLVFLYVGIVAFLSIRAKTIKEASSYISPIYIVVMVAGMLTMFSGNTDPALLRYAIPVYGSALCIQKVVTGGLDMAPFLLNTGATLLLGLLLTWLITRAFDDERIVMNA